MAQWVSVATSAEIPVGTAKEVVVGQRIVAVYHTSDGWYALDGICPHAGGPLALGQVVGQIVTCPWHGWQFDITTGQHCLSRSLKHPCFAVKCEADQVLVELPD